MPNKVDAFIKQKIGDAVIKYLKTIKVANGFNTDPAVIDGYCNLDKPPADFVIEVDDANEDRVADSLGQMRLWEQEITVTGWIRCRHRAPRRARNMLLQDVRTAILSNATTIGTEVTRGLAISLVRCETDQGLFLDDGWSGFEQTFAFRYQQSATW